MVIKKIKINGFGKLKDLRIPLKSGINVISGDNESRKINNCNIHQSNAIWD